MRSDETESRINYRFIEKFHCFSRSLTEIYLLDGCQVLLDVLSNFAPYKDPSDLNAFEIEVV